MENLFMLTLQDAQQRGVIVSLHTDVSDSSACSVGYVEQLSDCDVRLRAISPEGLPGGYEIRSLEDVYRVDIDGLYEKNIHFLSRHQGKIFQDAHCESAAEGESLLLSTLHDAAQHARKIVVLWTQDREDSIVGYVEDVHDETVKMLSIDEYGREDGMILVDVRALVSMDYNSTQCQVLEYVHDHWSE